MMHHTNMCRLINRRRFVCLCVLSTLLKGIGKEFQQLVTRRYLEKSTHKKLFANYSHYK